MNREEIANKICSISDNGLCLRNGIDCKKDCYGASLSFLSVADWHIAEVQKANLEGVIECCEKLMKIPIEMPKEVCDDFVINMHRHYRENISEIKQQAQERIDKCN